MSIRIELVGDTAVEAHLDAFSEKLHSRLLAVMQRLTLELWRIVVDENLAGKVLKRQSGALARAQVPRVAESAEMIVGSVGFNRVTVPYGVYHEFGVPHEWVIEAKKGKALRFMLGGEWVFRKKVVHPPLPERSFLRSALAQIAPQVKAEIEAAIAEASAE